MSLSRERSRSLFESSAPAGPLAGARIGIGLVIVVKAWHLATLIPSLASPGAIRVPYLPGISPGGDELIILAWALALAGSTLALGLGSRTSAALATVLLSACLLSDRQLYANHLYLLILLTLLLALSDCGAARSVDSLRHGRRTLVPAWSVFLLKVQLSIVYGFAALTKLNPSYLSGAALTSFLTSAEAWPSALLQAMSLASIVAELFIAIGLWFAPTRRWAAATGLALHAGMIALIDYPLPLSLFALELLVLYPLFFSPLRED